MALIADYLIADYPNGTVYELSFEKLAGLKIVRWSGNRPFDEVRIPEIIETILKNKQVHDTIKIAEINGIEYECYDGLHRLEAIREIVKKHPKNKNLKCMVYIMKEATQSKVRADFLEYNKSISVPEIYKEPPSSLQEIMQEIIIKTVKHFHGKFRKELFMPSENTFVPRENRDRFTNRLTRLYEELTPPDHHWFIKFLYALSEAYKVNIDSKMNEKKIKICRDVDFWLFSKKEWHVYQKHGVTKEKILDKMRSS